MPHRQITAEDRDALGLVHEVIEGQAGIVQGFTAGYLSAIAEDISRLLDAAHAYAARHAGGRFV